MTQCPSASVFNLPFFILALWIGIASGFPSQALAGAGTPAKSPEDTFLSGNQCIQKQDIACAKVALLRIPQQSPYAKILDAAIATQNQDFEHVFQVLLPLQVSDFQNTTPLIPEASASLHTSLALAYQSQADTLRFLEQRILAEQYLRVDMQSQSALIEANQKAIWEALIATDKNRLIEMRGASFDSRVQGWVDLALGIQSASNLDTATTSWRLAYPDHPANLQNVIAWSEAMGIRPVAQEDPVVHAGLGGKVAVLLPFASEVYYPVADAIERGFMAARHIANDDTKVTIYPTTGDKDGITALYEKAVSDGATMILGPLTRDEVGALTTGEFTVPTLTLNQSESAFQLKNLYGIGLSLETEAAQIAKSTRDAGMQTATIIAADAPLGARMAEAFRQAWLAEGGQVILQANLMEHTDIENVREEISSQPVDMIMLATPPEMARSLRGFLDITTPTYGFSHLYAGINHEPDDAALIAVRFTDLPWMIPGEDDPFSDYRDAAADLPQGMMQRWFALGADAYQVLKLITSGNGKSGTVNGLTGRIEIRQNGMVLRTLAIGRFSEEGVVQERMP